MKNEKTSKRVARIAGRILSDLDVNYDGIAPVYAMNKNSDLFLMGLSGTGRHITVADLKALAASALTQTKDKPKRKGRA